MFLFASTERNARIMLVRTATHSGGGAGGFGFCASDKEPYASKEKKKGGVDGFFVRCIRFQCSLLVFVLILMLLFALKIMHC